MEKVVAIIPARMGSTRFPGKPLALIMGLPMIEHVRRRVALCRVLDDVFVATCDDEIRKVVEASGGKAIMTAASHERCTDRVAEAAAKLDATVVVNVQGDEPLIVPRMVDQVVAPLLDDRELPCANLMVRIIQQAEFEDPNVVKAVVNLLGDLLYCSREPIPSSRKSSDRDYVRWKQLGVIAFRSDFLQRFARLQPTPFEIIESVDMMRAVEHGFRVRMIETSHSALAVDTPDDLTRVSEVLMLDPLINEYM